MLNPSTADEQQLDPTLRRVLSFSRAWGFGAFTVCNLFAFRSPNPRDLAKEIDPVGPDNDQWIETCAKAAHEIVAAWGNMDVGFQTYRDEVVLTTLRRYGDVKALRVSKAKMPAHPLYLPQNLSPVLYRARTS